MSAVTRIDDETTGTCDLSIPHCCPHGRTGIASQGSPNVFVNKKAAHRVGDGGGIICPHGGFFQSTQGSATVFVNGRPLTRLGDSTSCLNCGCSGSHISASQNVFAG